MSFASSHLGKYPYDVVDVHYGSQVLWPDHCIQGSWDAELAPGLDIPHAQLVIRKGYHADVDSYSAFVEADQKTMTGLAGYLRERNFLHCYVCGLATDFCVAWTALDARRLGFHATVIEDACQAIDLHGSLDQAWQSMLDVGVTRVRSDDLRIQG